MLLLLIILITLLVFLLFLCSSSLILYYLDMAWLYCVTVYWLFWTSQLRRADQQRQTVWRTRHLRSSFLPRGMCSLLSPKTKPVFSLGEPLLLLLLKRERCTDEREKFYICNRGDCFVCTTWFWNLSDFSETRNPS